MLKLPRSSAKSQQHTVVTRTHASHKLDLDFFEIHHGLVPRQRGGNQVPVRGEDLKGSGKWKTGQKLVEKYMLATSHGPLFSSRFIFRRVFASGRARSAGQV
jgi:hypothetical protein